MGKTFLIKNYLAHLVHFTAQDYRFTFFSAQIPKEVRKDLMLWKVGPKELCIL